MRNSLYLFIPALMLGTQYVNAAKFIPKPDQEITLSDQQVLVAFDDTITVVPNTIPTVESNLTSNDKNGSYVELTSSPVSDYGYVVVKSDGSFTYTLYEDSPNVTSLKVGDLVTDQFSYHYIAETGESVSAKLIVQIIGNPVDAAGNTVFQAPVDEPYDNVDVEFNDRSAQATPLNSGRNIKGHLHDSGDKDWYKIASNGNEIISLEVCPQGSSCFGKKSWVLYVFDSDKITTEMEEREFVFSRWVNETGSTNDEDGNQIITGLAGSSNHMYLAYRSGFFEEALIGVVDPCFDTTNKVEIGVGDLPKNYFIAISSPLKGNGESENCGAGTVVLEEPALNASGSKEGKPKTYATTREYITVFPQSDDQYIIKVTGTGLHPLLSEEAASKSSLYDGKAGRLSIPKVRVFDKMYQAELDQSLVIEKNKNAPLTFVLSDLQKLTEDLDSDVYQATYNAETQQVLIPRVTDEVTGNAYSVVLRYIPATDASPQMLELVDYQLIQ